MRLSEARGYVRARSAEVVHEQVDAELRRHPAGHARYRAELVERATEMVINLTIRELVAPPVPQQLRPAKAA